MAKRITFGTLEELRNAIKENPGIIKKKTPYRVNIRGKERYVFSGNSDQAVAAVCRENDDVEVESISISELL